MTSQWQNFLRNLGEWRGTFASMDASGVIQETTASILTLAAEDDGRLVRFRLRRFADGDSDGTPSRDISEDYRSLGRRWSSSTTAPSARALFRWRRVPLRR